MHSSICCVRKDSLKAGGNSSPQMGHSSSSAIWRRVGVGMGGGGAWRGNMLRTECEAEKVWGVV